MITDISIPILPSVDLQKTTVFYESLGFQKHFPSNDYLIMNLNNIEIHFVIHSKLVPDSNESSCFIRTKNVDNLFEVMSKYNNLPEKGIPRLTKTENKPWGIREFAIVDLCGNLLRIGQILKL